MDQTFPLRKTIDENIQKTSDTGSEKDQPKAKNYMENGIVF